MPKFKAFTFAEILITLAIVGVVSAMTLPTLVSKIKDKVEENQEAVFNSKLIKGLNLTKASGDINDTYISTEDFLKNALSKHLKMAKICSVSKIRDCIPYDKIKYEASGKKEEDLNVSDLKTAGKLRLKGGFKDIAAFVLADGTPAIVSYNLECVDDPDKADTSINSCLAGVFDINGTRKPNKFSDDIIGFNGATLGCLHKRNGYCVISKYPLNGYKNYVDYDTCQNSPLTKGHCSNSTVGKFNKNFWAWAMLTCNQNGGHLPSYSELKDFLTSINSDAYNQIFTKSYVHYTTLNKTVIWVSEPGINLTINTSNYTFSKTNYGGEHAQVAATLCFQD